MNSIIPIVSHENNQTLGCVSSDHISRTSNAAAKIALTKLQEFSKIQAQRTTWQRIREWWLGIHPCDKELSVLHRAIDIGLTYEAISGLLLVVFYLIAMHHNERGYAKSCLRLKDLLNKLPIHQLDALLHDIVQEKFHHDHHPKLINCCLDMLSLDKLKTLLRQKHEDIEELHDNLEDLQATAKALCENYPNKMDHFGRRFGKELERHSSSLLRFFNNFAHSYTQIFFKAHDFSVEDEPVSDRWEAMWRLSNFYQVIAVPMTVIGCLTGFLKLLFEKWWVHVLSATIVGLSSYIGARIYCRFFSYTPTNIGIKCRNLTQEAIKGDIDPVIGRQREVTSIIDCLGQLDKHGKTPLLVGSTGVGKTEIVKALAMEIASGKYPHLKNKQLFLINPADLTEKGGGGCLLYLSRLELLIEKIRGKEDQIILFFDEVHTIVGHQKFQLDEKLKTILDSGKIHCIAATTTKAYEETISKNDALNRRFRRIHIEPLDRSDCCNVLLNLVMRDYPQVDVTHDAIEQAISLTDATDLEIAQPSKAKDLIAQAINSVQRYEGEETIELAKLQDEYHRTKEQYYREGTLGVANVQGRAAVCHLKQMQTRIHELDISIADKQTHIKRLEQFRCQQKLWKERYINVAYDLQRSKKDSSYYETLSKAFLFIEEYILQELKILKEEEENILIKQNIPTCVDVSIVDNFFTKNYLTS